MKKFVVLGLCMAVYAIGYTQTITIQDAETGEPLEMVTLTSKKPKAFATTNAKGQTDLSAFESTETIEIRRVGYETLITNFQAIWGSGGMVIMNASNLTLDQVVVSASKWNQLRKDIPSRISSISVKDMALQNPQTAADLLAAGGEVFVQKSQQGGGSPMIRGFSTNRLLYTIDGVRMNTAIFRGGNLQNVISLDPLAIENTEVLFGPGSVIYGSDAIGGVMSFQTLTPQFSYSNEPLIKGKALARYSSANQENTGHFDINVGWKKWAISSSLTSFDYGDLKMGTHGPDEYLRPFYVQRQDSADVVVANPNPLVQRPTGYSQINLMQKVRFSPNPHWDFQYGFHYSATSDYSRYDRHIRYRDGLPRSAEWEYGPQKWAMNNLNITQSGNSVLYDRLTLRLAHQFFEESRIDRDMHDDERRSRVEKVNAYSINVDFNKQVGEKNNLYYGLEWVLDDINSTGTDKDISTGAIVKGRPRYPQASWQSYAAYVTYQHHFLDIIMLQGGLRYNQFKIDAVFDEAYQFPFTTAKLNKGALTGSLGLTLSPSDTWIFSANLSTGFRSPNIDDMGKVFDSEPGSVVIPNPDLSAEYAYNAELGMAKVFGQAVKLDFTAYYTLLDNALVRRDFTLNGEDSVIYDGTLSQVQAMQNAAVAKVYGVQAGIELKLGQGWGIFSKFNYQKGEEELDDGTTSPSRHAAPMFGGTHLTYTTQNLKLDLNAIYSGKVDYENLSEEGRGTGYIFATDQEGNPYSPRWYTLNFKALYQVNPHLSVSSGLENITDQRYRPYSSGVAAAGRNFIISLSATF